MEKLGGGRKGALPVVKSTQAISMWPSWKDSWVIILRSWAPWNSLRSVTGEPMAEMKSSYLWHWVLRVDAENSDLTTFWALASKWRWLRMAFKIKTKMKVNRAANNVFQLTGSVANDAFVDWYRNWFQRSGNSFKSKSQAHLENKDVTPWQNGSKTKPWLSAIRWSFQFVMSGPSSASAMVDPLRELVFYTSFINLSSYPFSGSSWEYLFLASQQLLGDLDANMYHGIFSRLPAPDTITCATHKQWHNHHLHKCAGDPAVSSGNYTKYGASEWDSSWDVL